MKNNKKSITAIALGAVLLLFAIVVGSNLTTVGPGEVGVRVTFGRMADEIYPPGLYSNVFSHIYLMSTRTTTYTMAEAPSTAAAAGSNEHQTDSTVQVLAQDQLSVSLDVSVQYHLNASNPQSVLKVFAALGPQYSSDIIHPMVRTAVRDAASEFRAIQLIDERARLQVRMRTLVEDRMNATLASRQIPVGVIVIDTILLRNIDLPNSLDEAIANVQRQRQETAQQEQAGLTATATANRARIVADGDSAALLIRTRADAEAARIRAQAQSDSNRLIAASLSPDILRMRQIELLGNVLSNSNTKIMMIPGGQTPLMMMPSQ